jgi:A/G-specific adenine glycosylase
LLRWFRRHGRDLPWRRTRDPYHIVVSEFMLQQTQVSRVEAFYPRFLARYPTIHALAAAPAATVRESWEGLGYYRRAANLHRLAQAVVGEHGGVVPDDPAAARAVESLVALGLATGSRGEFARPPAKPYTGLLSGFQIR